MPISWVAMHVALQASANGALPAERLDQGPSVAHPTSLCH